VSDYLTLASVGLAEYEIKRSRFWGYASPAASEGQAVDFINSVKTKHLDASHNVYAYSLKKDNIRRFSDAGEPSGTAGAPVLDILEKEGLYDCAVVVARYFGGTLLGTGGLVKAYSNTARMAVQKAGTVKMTKCVMFEFKCPYNVYKKALTLLESLSGKVENTEYAENIRIGVLFPFDNMSRFDAEIADIMGAKAEISAISEKYASIL